jgi:hypothetical protein
MPLEIKTKLRNAEPHLQFVCASGAVAACQFFGRT